MSSLSKFLMDEVEMPLIPVVADLEDNGYPIDTLAQHTRPDRQDPRTSSEGFGLDHLARIRVADIRIIDTITSAGNKP